MKVLSLAAAAIAALIAFSQLRSTNSGGLGEGKSPIPTYDYGEK